MQVGDVIADRFELRSLAGEGGMGVVYRAFDRLRAGEVAFKTMRRAGPHETRRFAREVQVLRGLSHPGIVRHVADGVSDAGEPWLAMEWLEGEDLARRLTRGPLTGGETLAVAAGIAEALASAHDAGLVHRDLKPSNVWIVGGALTRESVRLLDFGAVRRLDPQLSVRQTRAGAMIGTPGYLAPEQARGELDVDAAVDVYALGCVIFECLAGRPVFEGEQVIALLAKVLLEEPPRLSTRVIVPEALDVLVARMLAKDRAERPRDARDVARALDALDVFDVRPALVSDAPRPLSREQRWLCVLLVRSPSVSPDDATMAADAPDDLPIVNAAAASGARLEQLAGGAQVLLWESADAPGELAARAARAALAIRAATGRPLALASGRVAVDGAVPMGEALERAAASVKRSQGSVVLDDSIAGLLGERFEIMPGAEGLTLVGERAGTAETRTILGRATPCVGRDVEFSVLNAILAEVRDERAAAAVVLTGEMGVGKSRVRLAWTRALAGVQPEVRVWQAHADVMHERAAYAIAARLVQDACAVPFGADRERVRSCIADAVAAVVEDASRARVASRLCELCGAPWERDLDEALRTARQDAIVMGDQLRAAWEDFLVASCAAHPLVLVVENLQWADGASLSLLDRALRNFGDRPWMVLGLGRPEIAEAHPKLWAERGVREVVLGPLKERPAERLVRAVLGAATPDERVRSLVARAAGNAYFLEELLRAEAEGQGDQTPDTVLAMVEARLLRLEPPLRRVLRAASVYGARFDARGVEAVLGEARLATALESLVAREWLTALDGGGYVFRQSTSREAAYAMLLEEDKPVAHGRAAAWLAESGADPAAIAEHHERAQAPERAAPWWSKAAVQALEANDFPGCIARAEAAERCGSTGRELAEALLAAVEAHSWLNENPALLERVERLDAVVANFPDCAASAVLWESLGALRAGDNARVERALERARVLVAQRPEDDGTIRCALRVASIAASAGLLVQADAFAAQLEGVVPPLESRGARTLGVLARWRAVRAHHAHDVESCARLRRDAARLLRNAGDVRTAAAEESTRGYELVLLGAYDEAVQDLESSLAECGRLGLSYAVAGTRHNLGLALLGLGRCAEALDVERAAVEAFARGGITAMECASRDYASRILVALGRTDEAVAEAERAHALLPPEHPFAWTVRAALADALLARGGTGDGALALAHACAARDALRADSSQFEEPSFVLRVHVDALAAHGLEADARRARDEARAWVAERAAQIQSAHYRHTFLHRALDIVRILALPGT